MTTLVSKQYSAFLFDFDGCLFHSLPCWAEGIDAALQKQGIKLDKKTITQFIVPSLKNAEQFGITNLAAFGEDVFVKVGEVICLQPFHEEVLETIQFLYQHQIKYCVVTSSNRELLQRVFAHHQVSHLFPQIIAREDAQNHKPHPEPLLNALQLLKVAKDETIMIGDSPADIMAARAAGVDSVWFYPEAHRDFYERRMAKEMKPTYVIASMSGLQEFVARSSE